MIAVQGQNYLEIDVSSLSPQQRNDLGNQASIPCGVTDAPSRALPGGVKRTPRSHGKNSEFGLMRFEQALTRIAQSNLNL